MEAYALEINKPEHYWSFLNTDAVELIWVISAISSECLDEYFRNAPNDKLNTKVIFHCMIILYLSSLLISHGVQLSYTKGDHSSRCDFLIYLNVSVSILLHSWTDNRLSL